MYTTFMALALAVFCLDAAVLVNAGLFVYQPFAGSTCRGGEPCLISWVDDGSRPLFSAIGVSTVGLYTGKQQLVQTISPVDVTQAHSMTFIPNPAAGPNSDTYYIAITSTSLKGNNSSLYSGWSPNFVLTGMSGSFDTPLPAALSPIPVPVSLSQPTSSDSATRTVTVGVLSTTIPSSPPAASSSSSSKSVPVISSSSSTTVAPSSSSTAITPSSSSASSSRSLSSASKLSTVISSSSSASVSVSTASTSSTSPSSTAVASTSGSVGGASHLPPVLSLFAVALSLLLLCR